jgi:hypothetical protein
MNDIENELRQLTPARPSHRLMVRIEESLPKPFVMRFAWLWPSLAATTMAVLFFAIRAAQQTPATLDEFKPVLVENRSYGSRTGEVFLASDNLPRREVRRWYVDTYRWERPSDKAWIEKSVPREEVKYQLVAMQ